MKKIKYYILGLLVTCSVSSCEDYLTVLPENNQSSFEYWETKEDVEAVLAAGYVNLRSCVETFFIVGRSPWQWFGLSVNIRFRFAKSRS